MIEAQPVFKDKPKFQAKAKPGPKLKFKSRVVGLNENFPNKTPQNKNSNPPKKFLPKNKPGIKSNDSSSNLNSFFGNKNIGQPCSSNKECLSTNCVFKGQQSGKGSKPNPIPKPKPLKIYGSRSLKNSTNRPNNGTQAAYSIPVYGTCQNEIEQDPVPKGIWRNFL